MSTLTIHNLDDHLVGLIDRQAEAGKCSRNKVIKQLLAQSLGVKPEPAGRRHDDFVQFCGVWSAGQEREFNDKTREFERVDPGDWR